MNNLIEQIIQPENLQWAWKKVRQYYKKEAAWKNELEIISFEVNLREELESIAFDIENMQYQMKKIKPIPQPKKKDEGKDNLKLRPVFWINIRDQIAWVAIVNIIGPIIDSRMPLWSYGNRLYRSTWYEEVEEKKYLKIGPYRNTNGLLYRAFNQSWPLYRRYIYLTMRQMTKASPGIIFDLEDADENLLNIEKLSTDERKLPYLQDDYWNSNTSEVYWASIDFEKFYPNLNLQLIKNNILIELNESINSHLSIVLDSLIRFNVDYSQLTSNILSELDLSEKDEFINYLPTGLMVAGFLANTAMIDIDRKVKSESKNKQIAHFRYVDDHIILASNFDDLLGWIEFYYSIIKKSGIAKINEDKTVPEELKHFILKLNNGNKEEKIDYSLLKKSCLIDPVYPRPLMTKTLARVSQLAKIDFDFLDEGEQQATINDLELLLLADIGETELPEATRISFSATLLSRFTSTFEISTQDSFRISEINRKLKKLKKYRTKVSEDISNTDNELEQIDFNDKLYHLDSEIILLEKDFIDLISIVNDANDKRKSRTFNLLIKAIHSNQEKLRLWERAIDYCLFTGYKGISIIQSEIARVNLHSEIASFYLESFLFNYISISLIKAIKLLESSEHSDEDKSKVINYILDVISNVDSWSIKGCENYFHKESIVVFCLTLGNIIEILPFYLLKYQNKRIEVITFLMNNLNKKIKEFYSKVYFDISDRNLAKWIVWTESFVFINSKNINHVFLNFYKNDLILSDQYSWYLWKKYPSELSDNAFDSILNGQKKLKAEECGWFIDALQGYSLSLLMPNNDKFYPTSVKKFISSNNSEKTLSLYRWNSWVLKKTESAHFDPRAGEWTSLEIIRQILALPDQYHLSESDQIPPHPANVFIPISWESCSKFFITRFKTPTWESWKQFVRNKSNTIQLKRIISFNNDNRYFPHSDTSSYKYDDTAIILRAYGLLLLGLLSRNFNILLSGNSLSDIPYIGDVTKHVISSVSCSSHTTAILEACLLPRSRESILLQHINNDVSSDEDTLYDPPLINDKYELLKSIEAAQKILSDHQFTVQSHKPIQLIPLHIEQLNRFSQNYINNGDETDD